MRRFFKTYNEWFTIPISLVLFFIAPMFYHQIDETAGAFDVGVIHQNVYAIASLFLYSGVSWLLIKIKFPEMERYLDDKAESDIIYGTNTRLVKAVIPFTVYLSFILFQILIANQL